MQPLGAQLLGEFGDVGLVGNGREREWAGTRRLGRIIATDTMDQVDLLGANVVGL